MRRSTHRDSCTSFYARARDILLNKPPDMKRAAKSYGTPVTLSSLTRTSVALWHGVYVSGDRSLVSHQSLLMAGRPPSIHCSSQPDTWEYHLTSWREGQLTKPSPTNARGDSWVRERFKEPTLRQALRLYRTFDIIARHSNTIVSAARPQTQPPYTRSVTGCTLNSPNVDSRAWRVLARSVMIRRT